MQVITKQQLSKINLFIYTSIGRYKLSQRNIRATSVIVATIPFV